VTIKNFLRRKEMWSLVDEGITPLILGTGPMSKA